MSAAPRARVQRRPVHGVLLLDKPLGLTSNQALQKARWLLRAEKAGHTGTLDPLASGVLPLCFGAATKFSALHLDADKSYEATLRLGERTSTGDAEGDIVSRRPVPAISAEQLEAVRQRFLGRIQQTPPMHSALKKDGKPLYEYARAGVQVERAGGNEAAALGCRPVGGEGYVFIGIDPDEAERVAQMAGILVEGLRLRGKTVRQVAVEDVV